MRGTSEKTQLWSVSTLLLVKLRCACDSRESQILNSIDPGGLGPDRPLQPGRVLEIQNWVPPRAWEPNPHFNPSDSCVS